jgi:hypothetical protein
MRLLYESPFFYVALLVVVQILLVYREVVLL